MYNKVMLIGRLGRDPEFRTTQGGVPLATFSLATDERRRGENGETQTTTEWHRITAWRRQAEVARDYLRKGSLVFVEGKIHYSNYENREGQKVWRTDIVCDRFQMLDSRGGGSGGDGGGRSYDSSSSQEGPQSSGSSGSSGADDMGGMDDDDLPF